MEKKEIILGRNPVLEYLRSPRPGGRARLYVARKAHGKIVDVIIQEARGRGIPVEYRDRDFFREYPEDNHQGVLLIATHAENPSDEESFLRDVVDAKGVLVLLDQITDPHNVGAIIRTAEALGADAVVLPKAHSPEIGPTVIKASAGATAHIRIITVTNVASFLDRLKGMGYWVVGTAADGNLPLTEASTVKPAVVVIGSEGQGMRRLTEENCDYIVSIPLRGRISSLNASVAAGIVLYEILK